MRWDENHQSNDVDDRRGQGFSGGGGGGGGLVFSLLPLLFSRFGWLGVVIALVIGVGGYFLSGSGTAAGVAREPAAQSPEAKKEAGFVGFVLDDNQTTWTKLFQAEGKTYKKARLVLFSGATSTACGQGERATGPFYCPADQKVYIDLSFFRDLDKRFKAGGDFAQAYVIAHEIGHHVQHQLGTMGRSRGEGAEGASVRTELQADCYAGIWARSTGERKLLEAGDLDEALTAAAAIGDDRLQKQSRGTVQPESFTHGTSEQRARWLKKGYETGRIDACDTFSASQL